MRSETFIRELFDTVEEVERILEFDPKRLLSTRQRSIVLKGKMTIIVSKTNEIVFAEEFSSEEKSTVFERLLRQIAGIIAKSDKSLVDSMSFYRLHSIKHHVITVLMQLWGSGGELRVRGIANALANILVGIEVKFDFDEFLVDFDHPEFTKRFAFALNYINSTAGLFYIASCSLYNISSDYLIEWGTLALQGNEVMLAFFRKYWDISRLYSISIRNEGNPNRFYQGFTVIITIIVSMIQYLMKLYARSSDKWQESPPPVSFLQTNSIESFMNSIQSLADYLKENIQNFNIYVSDGTFNVNDRPLESPMMNYCLQFVEIIQYVVRGLSLVHNIIRSGKTDDLVRIKSLIQDIIKFLKRNSSILNDSTFFNSGKSDFLAEMMNYFEFFSVITAINLNDWEVIDHLHDNLGLFLSDSCQKQYPLLNGLILTISLFRASKCRARDQMGRVASQLIRHSSFLKYQPRDEFAFSLLGHLTLLVLGQETHEDFLSAINNAFSITRSFFQAELIDEIQEYIDALQRVLAGERPMYSVKRLADISPFDPFSFLIPDFTLFAKELNLGPIIYIPFNLIRDYVEYS